MKRPGILLVNLGSPDSPAVPDVRRYLREFLMDGRVLDTPYPIRFAVVNFMILPRRPKQSAEAYEKIWTKEGSPLIALSRKVQQRLQERMAYPVEVAMRYQNPSISSALHRLKQEGVSHLLLVPLFPHYAMSSYETAVVEVRRLLGKIMPDCALDVLPPYFDHPGFISALVENTAPFLEGGFDHLLFSFHGIPERHLRKSDPTGAHCLNRPDCCETESPAHATCYRAQCLKTMRAFAKKATLPEGRFSVSFQSRLGRDPWLKPYTDFELARLAQNGVKKLLVICPAFVSDCLETVEEIGLRGRETFLEAGGKEFTLIPCMNDHPSWIEALEKMSQARLTEFLRGHPAAA